MASDSNGTAPNALRLQAPGGGEIQATAFGAHALSWHCRGQERLYLSPRASFGAGKAIRGGVPVIFPQFGERGDGPRHGFVRTLDWQVLDTTGSKLPRLAFRLSDSEQTRIRWPHRFEAVLSLEPGENRLRIALNVHNSDSTAFQFTAALHTYLRVADVAGTLVHGLERSPFLDCVRGNEPQPAADAPVRFEGEVDRIYAGTVGTVRVTDGVDLLRIEAEGFADTVIWNPGAELAAGMGDLGAGEYGRFVCIEAAQVLKPVHLDPGASWSGAQILTVEDPVT
ncbi:D-hexose-6-phosphate mutarotase [Lysobacter antibioticus]|uniref:D-hexose-6-phosphate mutarotase n=1 Tax=Lysobacter antibioticus TaxID=84531 RepID=UPI00068B6E9A|nr:D-hexose-6-phosphate mutarotase [Lysobacter antibioticus]